MGAQTCHEAQAMPPKSEVIIIKLTDPDSGKHAPEERRRIALAVVETLRAKGVPCAVVDDEPEES